MQCSSRGLKTFAKQYNVDVSCCLSNKDNIFYPNTLSCSPDKKVQTTEQSPRRPIPGTIASTVTRSPYSRALETFDEITFNSGLSKTTEQIIFIGLPCILLISLLVSFFVLIGLSLKE